MPYTQSPTPRRNKRSSKATRSSKIAEALRQTILRGDLKPGSKVNLDQLREHYDVSLSPLREAISRLVAVGLVEFVDQRGYYVAPVSVENLREVTALRAMCEGRALAESIAGADVEWESEVLAALHRLDRIRRDPGDQTTIENWEAAHTEFHMALIAGCDMPMLQSFCATLHNLNDRYRRILIRRHAGDRDVQGEHDAIAQAAVARDAEGAVELLRKHIERTGDNLLRHLKNQLDAGEEVQK